MLPTTEPISSFDASTSSVYTDKHQVYHITDQWKQTTELGTYTSSDSMEDGEETSHVLLGGNTAKELRIWKLCRPKTAIKVECHLVGNNWFNYICKTQFYCAENVCHVNVFVLFCGVVATVRVCDSFVLYTYSAQPRLQVSQDARPLRPAPDRHRATQAHPPSQQGRRRLVLRWPDVAHTGSIYLLSDSQHWLQLRCSYSWM